MALQVETYRGLAKRKDVRTLEIGGGVAALTENIFGRKLNHVTGLGMGTPVSVDAVEQLETAYNERGRDVEIDLCPHADDTTLAALTERGCAVNAFSNTYVRMLRDEDLIARAPDGIEIVTDRAVVDDVFVSHSIAGVEIQAVPRPPLLLEALARIAVAQADTMLFAAKLNGYWYATSRCAANRCQEEEVREKQKTAVREGSGLSCDGWRMRDSASREIVAPVTITTAPCALEALSRFALICAWLSSLTTLIGRRPETLRLGSPACCDSREGW